MYLLKNAQFFYKHSSNLDAGVEGLVLLNNDFYYSFTLFDTFTAWKRIEELEDQYSNEQLDSLEKELLCIYEKALIPVALSTENRSLVSTSLHSYSMIYETLKSMVSIMCSLRFEPDHC